MDDLTDSPADPAIVAAVMRKFRPLIIAEIGRVTACVESAKAKAIIDALDAANDQPDLDPQPPRPKGPWARMSPEQRSAEIKRRWAARKAAKKSKVSSLRTVDLFAGAGGLSLGFQQAGFDIVAAFDKWPSALATYRANFDHPAIEMDLSDVDAAVAAIRPFAPQVIVGSPPCGDFSLAGKMKEGASARLTVAFAEIVTSIRPAVFIMENVPRARQSEAFASAREIFRRAGYGLNEAILDASRCRVPQKRRRLFLVGALGFEDRWSELQRAQGASVTTLRDAFGDQFPDHHYRHPRGAGRRAIFRSDEPSPTIRGTNSPMPKSYRRRWGDSADPETVRPLTHIERAAIQTFPPGFKWRGSKTDRERQVGNAVPVAMARTVAEAVSGALIARRGQANALDLAA